MKSASCYLRFRSCFGAKNCDPMTMAKALLGHEFMAILCIFLEENTKPHRGRQLEQKEAISFDLRASIWATKSAFLWW